MHTEYFLIDEGSDGQAVEHVTEDLPESDGISSLTFIVKAINSIDLCAFVIASQKEEVLGVFDLVA